MPERSLQPKSFNQNRAKVLLAAASVGALMVAMPAARAQSLPAGCSDGLGGNFIDDGETITCVVAPPGSVSSINTTAADLTVNVGSASTPTRVDNDISLDGGGSQRLFIFNTGSDVVGTGNAIDLRGDQVEMISQASIASAGGGQNGVYARVLDSVGDLNLSSAGNVYGFQNGVRAFHGGYGDLLVTVANVSSNDPTGVFAGVSLTVAPTAFTSNSGGGPGTTSPTSDIRLQSHTPGAGQISGARHGVDISNQGSGGTLVNIHSATGGTGDGVLVDNVFSNAGAMTVTTTGHVSGVGGISIAQSSASYGVMLTANQVTGTGGNAISVADSGSGGDVDVMVTGAVSAADRGVELTRGASTAGNIILNSTGTITSGTDGVLVDQQGTGAIDVTVANVSNTDTTGVFQGVDLRNAAMTTGNISLNSSGSISGDDFGVLIINNGYGDVTVDIHDAAGRARDGVRVHNDNGNAGNMSVTTRGHAQGLWGVNVDTFSDNYGLTLNVADVTGTGRDAVTVTNRAGAGDINVIATGTITGAQRGFELLQQSATGGAIILNSSGSVVSNNHGVFADQDGLGAVDLTVNDVTVNAGIATEDGVSVSTVAATTGNISVTRHTPGAGTIIGNDEGVDINNAGTGSININVHNATGRAGHGILAQNTNAAGQDLTIASSGAVTGLQHGVFADQDGTGAVSITTNNVTSNDATGAFDGVYARNVVASTGNVSLISSTTTGTIEGDRFGANVVNSGTGALTVDVANVTGRKDDGIFARNANSAAGALSVTASGAVVGAEHGVFADQAGTGAVSIAVNNVSSLDNSVLNVDDSLNFDGVNATNVSGSTGAMIIQSQTPGVGSITGNDRGVEAVNNGTGALTIDVNDVASRLREGVFINNVNAANANAVIVTTRGAVVGATHGINVNQDGTGAVSVTTNNVTSIDTTDTFDGVYARNVVASTGNVSLISSTTTGTIEGDRFGANVVNSGTGALTVDVANVTGRKDDGIFARNANSAAGALSVTASGAVSGAEHGVFADQDGTGAVSITVNNVTSTDMSVLNADDTLNFDGVYTTNVAGGAGAMTIQSQTLGVGSITGNDRGIEAVNNGTGALTIDVNDVTSRLREGVFAHNANAAGGAVSITARGEVTGGAGGTGDILAIQDGVGAVSVDVTSTTAASDITVDANGNINATNSAIAIVNEGLGVVSIDAVNLVSTALDGVSVENRNVAAGGVSITATGDVTGGRNGLFASQNGAGALNIAVNNVTSTDGTGNYHGLFATSGGGGINILATGTVQANGRDGVHARLSGAGGNLDIDVVSVLGGAGDGIDAQMMNTSSTGILSIDATGDVTGGQHGVNVRQDGTGAVMLTVNNVTSNDTTGLFDGIRVSGSSNNTGGVAITSSTGTITGDANGISVQESGLVGNVAINIANVVGRKRNGIFASKYSGGSIGDLMVTSTGDVSGGTHGIAALHAGDGAVDIRVNNVTSTDMSALNADDRFNHDGVYAFNTAGNSSELRVQSVSQGVGAIIGNDRGIDAVNNGTGAMTIDVNDVASRLREGVFAHNANVGGGALSVTARGDVTGGTDDILAIQDGVGAVSVNVTSTSATSDISVDANGDINTASDAIAVVNEGAGAVVIDAIGAASTFGAGILVDNRNAGAGAVSITATGDVDGNDNAIEVLQNGTGAVSVNVHNVSAPNASGGRRAIEIRNAATSTGDVFFRSTGTINTNEHGVDVLNRGAGALTIDVVDIAHAITGTGVSATNSNALAGDLSLSASGDVDGRVFAAQHSDTGGLSIDVVSADSVDAGMESVFAVGDLMVAASGDILSNGLEAANRGTGAISIDVGNVTGGNDGIRAANHNAGGGDITINASGDVVGNRGIIVDQNGIGDVDLSVNNIRAILTTPAVPTLRWDGILVSNDAGSLGDINITSTSSAGLIDALETGVYVDNAGFGAVTVDVANVSSRDMTGIDIRNANAGAGNLSITAGGDVTGGQHGVSAQQNGTGLLSINVNNVTSTDMSALNVDDTLNFDGVYVDADAASAGAITVRSDTLGVGSITGNDRGVEVVNNGTGSVSVDVNDVASRLREGILINNVDAANANAVTVTARGDVVGATHGINVNQDGTGAVTVRVNNASSLDNSALNADDTLNFDGVYATNVAGSTGPMTIRLQSLGNGSITGNDRGIEAINNGTGALTIDVNDVTSRLRQGIFAHNTETGNTNAVSITTRGDVTAAEHGVYAVQSGAGGVVINTNDISATSEDGINVASQAAATGDIDITASGVVSAGARGIHASHEGSGEVILTATGAVSGVFGGVDVDQSGTGGVSVDVNSVSSAGGSGVRIAAGVSALGDIRLTSNAAGSLVSGEEGVSIRNQGAGSVLIDLENVTGTSLVGVTAINDGGDMSINIAGDVSAGATGVSTTNNGAGALSVTSAGTINGGFGGVAALQHGDGGLTITVNDVVGTNAAVAAAGGYPSLPGYAPDLARANGVMALNTGSGDLVVTSAGALTGSYSGVAVQSTGSGDVVIDVADAAGTAADGIFTSSRSGGLGAMSIVASGTVSGGENGVYADHNQIGALTISLVNAVGGADGIWARNDSMSATEITLSGDVTGGTGHGVNADAANGVSITLLDGATVSGGGGAIITGSAGDILSLNEGAAINGTVDLGAGNDTVNLAGGSFTVINGGDGIDTFNFVGDGVVHAGETFSGFEIFNFDSDGHELAGDHVVTTEVNFLTGAHTLSGNLQTPASVISEGAALNARDGSSLTGDLAVEGMLEIGNSPGTFNVDGNVVFEATSLLPIEIEGADHDRLIASGNVVLGGALDILILGDITLGETTRSVITANDSIQSDFDNIAVTDDSGLLISHTVSVSESATELNLVLVTNVNTPTSLQLDGVTDNEISIGDNLIDLLTEPELDRGLAELINSIGAIPDENALAAVLGEFNPESLDAGLKIINYAQDRFVDTVLDNSRERGGVRAWTAIDASAFDQDGGAEHFSFNGENVTFMAGASGLKLGPFALGAATAYTTISAETEFGVEDDIDADMIQVAVSASTAFSVLGVEVGFDNALSYAYGGNALAMRFDDPVTESRTGQRGEADVYVAGWMARLDAKLWDGDRFTFTPHLQGGGAYYHQDDVDLGEGQATALEVDSIDNIRAEIGAGATIEYRPVPALALTASATGVRYFGDTQNIFETRFAATPLSAPGFETRGRDVDDQIKASVGMRFKPSSNLSISAEAYGETGDVEFYGGRLAVSLGF